MVRTDLPYTYCNRKRLKTGVREYWRFRREGIDTPLPGNPISDMAAIRKYADLMDQAERRTAPAEPAPRHSFAWLSDAFLTSAEVAALADITSND